MQDFLAIQLLRRTRVVMGQGDIGGLPTRHGNRDAHEPRCHVVQAGRFGVEGEQAGLLQALQIFAQPYILTQGGPGDASRFLVLYLYESGFRHLDMGYASAIAWVLFAISAVLVGLALASSRKWVHYAVRRQG